MTTTNLRISGLTKSFGGVRALDGVDLTVPAGQVHALLGHNGAGKSTLIKCLSGAMTPDGGTIRVDGQEVTFRSTQEAREAGIDLSIGAVMVLSTLVMAKLVSENHVPGFVAFLVGFVIAVVAETINGLLVTRIKLPPFIVTLGTLSIFTAMTLIYAQGQVITLDKGFLVWTGNTIGGGGFSITTGVLLMLLLYLGFAYALRQTAWGRHLYATGDDVEAARLAGIRTNRVLLSAYVVCGAVVGLTAWIQIGRINGADPNAAINLNLESITAVVIGGTSLFGGRGVIVGSLIGALIVQVFTNGLALAGVDPNYQVLAVGILVIVAVAADQWIRSVKS